MYISPINAATTNTNTNFKAKKLPISYFQTKVIPGETIITKEGLLTSGPSMLTLEPDLLQNLRALAGAGLASAGIATANTKDDEKEPSNKKTNVQ